VNDDDTALEVLAHINTVTGSRFRVPSAELNARIREGATVEQCKLVVDYLWSMWKNDPKMREYLDSVTPFRPRNFAVKYLPKAERWLEEGSQSPIREAFRKHAAENAEPVNE